MTDGGLPVSSHRSATLAWALITPLGGVLSSLLDIPSGPPGPAAISSGMHLLHVLQTIPGSSVAFSLKRLFLPFVPPESPDRCCRLAPVIATLWESRDGVHFAFQAWDSLHRVLLIRVCLNASSCPCEQGCIRVLNNAYSSPSGSLRTSSADSF